ncbi:MAG: thiamine phosphate synthase [Armatimonadia bacterium]
MRNIFQSLRLSPLELRSRLYFVVGAGRAQGRSLRDLVQAAVAGGAGMVQYDGTGLSTREMVTEATELVWACRQAKVPMVVYGRCDVALACTAEGVHVEGDDMPVALARRLMGPSAIVGVTARCLADAREAERQGATYVSIGPVFASATDPERAVVGLQGLEEIQAAVRIPVCAIGGIRVENVSELRYSPAQMVAVVSAISQAEDPMGATRELVERLRRPQAG